MTAKLAPCPKCGSVDLWATSGSPYPEGWFAQVSCNECDFEVSNFKYEVPAKQWNSIASLGKRGALVHELNEELRTEKVYSGLVAEAQNRVKKLKRQIEELKSGSET